MKLAIDETYVTETLQRLVQIESTNPTLNPSNNGEGQIAAALATFANELGMQVEVEEVVAGRPNVMAVLKGSGGGRSLIINGHTDTVGVEGMSEPFSGAMRNGKIYGRGSQDMKGSLAAMLAAAKAIIERRAALSGDLILTFVIDEEAYSEGTMAAARRYSADSAIVTEPTDLSVTCAHRGFIWFEVEIFGRAAHGSRFMEGIDANMRMGRFLARLDLLEKELLLRPPHALAGPPSLHAAMIRGGSEVSIYADYCRLTIERRTIPGETVESTQAELQKIIDELSAEDQTFRATVKATFSREPFEVSEDAAIVQLLDEKVAARLEQPSLHTGQTFWTDAAILSAAGIETVLIGPTGYGLHSAEEWVDLASTVDLAHILAETAVAYCQ